jgi:hypothetical protein
VQQADAKLRDVAERGLDLGRDQMIAPASWGES